MSINKSELISKVFINVLFISVFIAVFFFTYGSYIMKKVVINQIQFLSTDIKNLFGLFGENINNLISQKIDEATLPYLSEEDNKIKYSNNSVKNKTLLFLLIFTVIVLSIVYFIYVRYNNGTYQLNEIISQNIVILIAFAITQYVFLAYFLARYIIIDPNIIKLSILETLREEDII